MKEQDFVSESKIGKRATFSGGSFPEKLNSKFNFHVNTMEKVCL